MSAASPPGQDFAFLSAAELTQLYRRRTISPVEVATQLLDRVAMLDPPVNAIVHTGPELTMAQARAAEARYAQGAPLSALDGVPVTVKDLSALAGWPLRRGSLTRGIEPVAHDSPAVARLREAGAVFLAKTATPEGGCKVVTRSAVHGVTANPYDLSKTPGGSSGGAAAALAMGFGPLALGSDGAGSIRIPASFTNVFGIKPGFGRVPAFPPDIDMPMSVVGPLARTVADASAMLEILSRPDKRDPFAWPVPFQPGALATDLAGLRIAVSPRLGCNSPLTDMEVDRLTATAGPLLAAAGATITEEDPVWPVDPYEPFRVFWESGCMASVDAHPAERRHLLDPLMLTVAEAGRRITLPDYFRALEQRIDLAVAAQAFFNRFDLLVGPVMPVPPYAVTRDVPEGFADEDWRWCPYTYIWNMTGQPACSVPIGFTTAGLPVGVQIIGRMGEEHLVLRAAAAIERTITWKAPDLFRPAARNPPAHSPKG
jgi:aspartyl-tRNA(Asn)/glutamyl-tRNA(Gln) amidotransferase subunit A